MPCDSISTATLDLTKADMTALKAAMQELGYTVQETVRGLTFSHKSGNQAVWTREAGMTITSRRYAGDVAEKIQAAYTSTVVTQTAKRLGWQVTKKSEGNFVVVKR